MKLPFRTSIVFALCLGLSLLVLTVAASCGAINSLTGEAQQESAARQKTILLEQVVSEFNSAEFLQQRYLLGNSEADLAAYQQARAGLLQVLLRMPDAQVVAEGRQDWRALESAIIRRLEFMDLAVRARQQGGLQAATAMVGSALNRQLHDEINGRVSRVKSNETQAFERSKEETRQTGLTVKRLILLGGLMSLGVLAWAILMIIRSQAKYRGMAKKYSDSEIMSRAVTESMAEGVLTASQDGVIVSANSTALHLFGYGVEGLVGRNVAALLPKRYQMGFTEFFSALADRPAGFREPDTKILGLRRDGAEFSVNASFGDVSVGGRRLFTATLRDMTESNRINEALRNSKAQLRQLRQLRQLTDTVPVLIAYLDKQQRVQFHNKAYEEAFGMAWEQIHHKTMREIMGLDLYAQVEMQVRRVLAGHSVRYEREQVTASGERRDYAMTYSPRYGENDEQDLIIGFFSTGNDITELKRMDRMKTEFVSTVSHELRTPLTSIRGSLGLVWGGITGELPEKAKLLIGIAKNNCERLIRLINDILDIEKIESSQLRLELQALELAPLMEQLVAANEGFAAQHNVKLQLHAMTLPVWVHVDSDRLAQVVTNLLSNAIKFSPPQGLVQIVVRSESGRARVEISDKGPGIPEDFRQRIFQKFSQADSSDTRQKGGTGLGLNISKAILERMGGSIGFTTQSGLGTTFFFELPEWREAPPVTAPMGLYGAARPRILVCEDDPDVAQLIGMMLDKGGFDADMAHTAAQARDCLKMTSYAAMTVDLKLPHENGLALIRALRQQQRTAELPVLVLSVTAGEAQLRAAAEALAIADWLDKPLDEQRLLQSLRRAIKSSRASQPAESL
ncbi:MAG: ATPase [Burkholderiales bacterium RIFCSPHIGHO2_12_FULL_61_11]|nr:MAG: ATPase [Burkholderiales bacterium RIFCSPHIGHO2_12_FULL_61_11]